MDAVADSLDERFKMKPSVLNPLAPPPVSSPSPAVNPGPTPGMVPGEGDDFAVKGRRTQREAPAIPDEGDSFAIKGRKPASEYDGVSFKGRPRVSPKPTPAQAPAQNLDEYDAAIENIKQQREAKRRAKAPAAEIQALDGAAQNLITQKDLVSRGWILDRRFGLMDPGQQESMILAGEKLDPVWGTPQNLRDADPADLERLGIARPKPKPFTPPAPPQGRANTLAELLGMDSEEDARRYAQSLSPLERERLGLPQRVSEGQRAQEIGAAPQNQARSEGSTGESVTLPDRGGRVIEPPGGAPTGGNGTESTQPVNPDEMTGGQMRRYLKSIGVDNRGDVATMRERIKQVQRGEAPTPYTPAGPAPTGWQVSDNLKKSVEHAKARPGWRLEHLSDSGSAYLVHEASGKMVRVSDHAVPQTREREMFGGVPPWAGNEAINQRTGDARREFDRIAQQIEDDHAETLAESNPPESPDSSNDSESPKGSTGKGAPSRLLGTRNRDTEEMRRARQRVESRKFRAFDRRQVEKENAARRAIDHGFSGKTAPSPITRKEAEAATTDDMEALGQRVVESAIGRPFGKAQQPFPVGDRLHVKVVDYRPVDPTKGVYAEHETKVKQIEIWLADEHKAKDQRDALLRTLKIAGYTNVRVNGNENGLVVQFVPTNDDVITQPQGQVAATTNKEPSNGQEEGRQEGLLTEERARLLDAIVKQENADREARGLFNIEEQIQLKGTDGNWYYANGFPQGVRSTGERRVRGYAVGSQSFQTREQAEKYVADRKAGDDIRADLADSSIEELRKIAGTAAPAESSEPRGTGVVGAEDDADAMLEKIKEQLGRGSGRQSADMIRAFQELGSTLVPGVRLQDAEEVGRMYAMLDDGTVTLAEYANYIEDLRKSGKVAKPSANAEDDALVERIRAKNKENADLLARGIDPTEVAAMDRKIDAALRIMERTKPIFEAPQQTPGPMVTGRSGYTMGKKLDAENNRRADAFREYNEADKDRHWWETRKAAYLAGEVHANGQPRADAPSRKKSAIAKDQISAWLKTVLKPGQVAYVAGNSPVTVKRVNDKTITTASDTKWDLGSVTPKHATEDRPMTPSEVVAAIKDAKPAPAATEAESTKLILWGRRDGGPWLKLTSNTSAAEMKRRKADGWEVLKRAAGDSPENDTKAAPKPAGMTDSQIRAAKRQAEQDKKKQRRAEAAKKAAETKAFNNRNPSHFTRGHIAEQIMRLARSLPDTDTQYGVLGNADDSKAPGDYISFSFTGKIPEEVLQAIDAEPHLRTLLRVVPSGGLGADWMGHLGVDEYVRQLRLTFYEGHGKDNYGLVVARRKLEHWRGGNAEADFLLWALDRIENIPDMRPDWEMVPAADITPGSTLKIIGEDFDATADKYGEIVLSDGIEFPLQVLEAYGVPVDKGTMKKGTQEPAPKPETPDFGIEDAADPLAAVSDRIESTETITMDDGETATIYKLADGFEVVDSPEGVELRRRVGPGVQRLGTYSSVEDAIGSVAPKIAPENEWLPPKDDGEAFRAWAMSLVTGLESRVGMVRTATNEADEKGVFFTVSNKAGGQSTYGVRAFKGRAFVVESTGGYMNKGAAHVLSEHPNARTALVEAITLEDAHKPVKAEPAPVSTEEATKILADKGIIVTKTTTKNGTPVWELTGQTFDHKDAIRSAGGRWYGPKKAWSVYDEQAITKLAGTIGGGGTVDGGGAGQAAGVVADSDDDLARQRARERLDATPDERGTGEDYARTVTAGTAALIRKGEAFGIPTDVATEQIEDIGMAMAAHRQGRKLFIIGNDAGSGKTFVLGGIIREMRAKFPAVVYVTMNQDLIEQIKRNLKDYDIGGVTFATYSDLSSGKVDSTPGQLLILDEAHNIKNTESARGKNGKKAVASAGFTVFASATPYENPVQAEYLAPTGVFDEAGGHTEWAKIYGAAVRKWKDSEGTHEEVYWVSTKDSTKDALQAKGWLERKGVFTQRRIRLDPAMVQARFRRVPVEQKWLDLFNRVLAVYDDALSEWKDPLTGRSRDPRVAAKVAMHRENALKRILEAAKVNAAIDRAKEELAAGRKVAMFVETKSEREIGRYRKSDAKPNSESYTFPQMQAIMAEWEQDRAADRAAGDRGQPPPFSPAILTIAAAMHDAGIDETLPSVVDEIEAAFGKDAALYTGSVTPAKAAQNREAWRLGKFKVLIITMDKGGTGLSLHDTVGDQPTTQINVNMPWTATKVKQVSARTGRYGLKSKVVMEWLFSADIPFEKRLARRVGGRIRDMGATVSGINIASATKLADFDFKADEDIGDMALGMGTEPEADTNGIEEQYRQANRLEAAERRADDTSGDFFQTPHPIALFMARVAGITDGTKVLEPSAGMGRIVRYIPAGASLTMIEQHPGRVRKLEAMNRGKVVNTDFVQWAKDNKNTQDVVLMNPPFSRIAGEGWQDVSHVMAAWETLREGGRLVAVMSVGFTFHQDQQSAEFREWVESTGATVFKLPERAFKNSGTGVRTVLLIADKRTGDYADAGEYQVDSMEELPSLEDEVPSRALDRDEKPKEPAPKAANPAAPTPPKFSDSEGVFGQKTENITGTQRGMFGDISPEPTPDMQERYPGIRRGETVAEYEKRMGTTDTPDMFGGPSSSGGDPKRPQRAPSNMADRAIGALERIAADAEARMQARAKKRGTRLYSTPIPDPRDMIDAAAWAAGKALVAGIKGSRAIGKFITDQVAARWPEAKFDPAVLRRTARRFMDGAKTPQDVYARWQAARNKDDAARTRAAAGAAADPKAVKEAAAVGTAQRPDVAARIVAEVRKSFRAGKEAGRVQALAALKPVITKAKQAAIRAEQMRKIEQRGSKDAAAAATQAAKVQAETEAGIRDEAVRLVQSIPGVGRRYLKAVSTAKGMRDLQKILHRLRKDLAKSVARDSRRRAQVMARLFKKLSDERREIARKALYDIEEAWKAIKSKDTGTIRAEELAQSMREAAERIKAVLVEQRDEDKVRLLNKIILASEHREQMVERITKQPMLPQPEKVGADRTPNPVRLLLRKYANFRTLMQIFDGQYDENGIFSRMVRAMAARRTLELGKNQEFIDRAEAIVKANGYKSWADFTKRTTGSLGDASVDFVNIELGDRKRIPVGLAMALYAQDPETKSLMHEGQVFKFHKHDLEGFTVDDYKLAELEAALKPAQKTIAVAINRLRSEMQFDRADEVYKDITGNRMVKVPDHYPRHRLLDQTGSDKTMDLGRMSMEEWAVQSLENAGFTIQRVNSRAPLLLSDFAETQVRAFQGAEMMIQRAQLVKYLKNTIAHPDVLNQIDARYGTAMARRVLQVLAEYSGNSQPESDKIIRRIASKLAQTMTQVNPLTWLRNLSTVFRLPLALVDGAPMGVGAVLAALPEAAANANKTMRLLLRLSPDLRHRWSHAGAAISLMPTGAAPDADSHFADAGKATIRQLLHAAKGLRNGRAGERFLQADQAYSRWLDTIKLGNVFDAFAAVVAYHVFRAKAPTNLSPAAQDRWAAKRATDAFMQTANTNDLLNATEFQTDARRNTMTALLLTFTSDIAKMQNLLFLARKRGGKSMGVTAGSIVASVAWSTAIRYVAAAVLGDDEEKRDEEAVQSVMDELISLLPGGVNLWAPAFKLYTTGSTYGGSGLLDTPLTSLVRHFEAIVRELKKDDTNTAEAAYRLFRLVADPMGNPVGPLSGMARRAIKNYGE